MRPAAPRTRPQDWPDRLVAYLAQCRPLGFAWGTHDCASFAAGWVQAVHGFDPLDGIRGTYASEAEYEALLQEWGGLGALLDQIAAIHELPECPPAFARRGDIVLAMVGNMEGLGIMDAVNVAVVGPDRMRLAPRSAILRAWVV